MLTAARKKSRTPPNKFDTLVGNASAVAVAGVVVIGVAVMGNSVTTTGEQ